MASNIAILCPEKPFMISRMIEAAFVVFVKMQKIFRNQTRVQREISSEWLSVDILPFLNLVVHFGSQQHCYTTP